MVDTTKKTMRLMACLITVILFANIMISIASARASHYISVFGASMSAGNNGNVTVAFNITGTGKMTEIGTTRIEIHENGTLVRTFVHTTTSGMMGSDKVTHTGTVTYKGVIGRTYRATVSFRAANSNGSDSRAVQTNSVIPR